jgi:hypothetical protein
MTNKVFLSLSFSIFLYGQNIQILDVKFNNNTFVNLTNREVEIYFPEEDFTYQVSKTSSLITPCSKNPLSEVLIDSNNILLSCSKKYIIRNDK